MTFLADRWSVRPRSVTGRINTFWQWLPKGTRLPDSSWNTRHRLLLAVTWANVPLLGVIALRSGVDAGHLALELAIVLVLIAGSYVVETQASKAVLISLALVSCSGLLVHFTDGLIESHFHFFVVIPLVSLYRDWRPPAVGLAFVVAHTSIVGGAPPRDVS